MVSGWRVLIKGMTLISSLWSIVCSMSNTLKPQDILENWGKDVFSSLLWWVSYNCLIPISVVHLSHTTHTVMENVWLIATKRCLLTGLLWLRKNVTEDLANKDRSEVDWVAMLFYIDVKITLCLSVSVHTRVHKEWERASAHTHARTCMWSSETSFRG